MCGIAGEIRFDGSRADRAAVERINLLQRRRGPDGEGVFAHGPVALGHRRLSIIDISERGAQPMYDSELGLAVVFNGCIYNYKDLRRELTQSGHGFRSTSDTEVILKAYAEWGESCVERFNGMFAFAVLEQRTGRVFAARDRLGIKPFYYTESGQTLRFASSLAALLSVHEGETAIDPVSLHHYMSFHSVVPAPRTILRDVRKLPPATTLTLDPDGRRRERRYWAPGFGATQEAPISRVRAAAAANPADFEACKHEVLATLQRSVRRRMTADVPVGVLLSGGVDSSLVVALLAEQGVRDLETFSIGFETAGDEAGNEFAYSDLVADKFGTRHHKIKVSSENLVEHLPGCFEAMSEPMVSHDNIAFYLLSREVAKHVKVVQSGQGADEIFGGYFWYPPLLESSDAAGDYARAFFDRDHAEMSAVLHPRFVDEDYSRAFVAERFAGMGDCAAVDKALCLDTTVMLVEDPLKRVDNMTMAWSLEARVPFLDHELVELAARIPARMKVSGGGKHVLKEAARSVLPHEVIDRPKGYFPVPELKYLNGHSLEFVQDALGSRAARERELFQPPYLDRLLAAPAEHLTPLRGSKLWQLAALEVWLQTHRI